MLDLLLQWGTALLVSGTGNKCAQKRASEDELPHLGNASQELLLKIILL